MADLISLRKEIKSKKPNFIRQRYHTKARLAKNWRKSRGRHSKLRLAKGGHRAAPTTGYGSPSAVRGFDKSGLKPVIVSNSAELLNIQKGQGALISSVVGNRKRLSLVEEALKKNIPVINIKDLKAFIEKTKKEFEERVQRRKDKLSKKKKEPKKEAKKEVKKEVKKEEPKKPEEKTEDDKKVEDKKEKDKILATKK
jgi:large subunit ribosomal protein L32e